MISYLYSKLIISLLGCMSKPHQLVITHKSARLRELGLLDEYARHRSFAPLRMTKPRAVILSGAKDLSRTYGRKVLTNFLQFSVSFLKIMRYSIHILK